MIKFRKQHPGETAAKYRQYARSAIHTAYKNNRLTPLEIEACEAKGFAFIARNKKWIVRLEEAIDFKNEFGKWKPSCGWIAGQKQIFKKGKLADWKIEKLKDAGIDLIIRIKPLSFEERVAELKAFHKEYGREPQTSSTDKVEAALGNWANSKKRRNQLQRMGLLGFYKEKRFNEDLNKFIEFRKIHKRNPKQTKNNEEEFDLAIWRKMRIIQLKKLGLYEI